MAKRTDPNPAYWDDYTSFQQVKHDLIRCYLNGWYPKLGFWAGRVLYVDTHAGRGKYKQAIPVHPSLRYRPSSIIERVLRYLRSQNSTSCS